MSHSFFERGIDNHPIDRISRTELYSNFESQDMDLSASETNLSNTLQNLKEQTARIKEELKQEEITLREQEKAV